MLGSPLAQGYHLLEVSPGDEEGGAALVPDADLSRVQLRIAPPDTLTWPL
jgi:hypothetical protein